MPLDRDQLVRVYTARLVSSLVPKEFGDEYVQSLTNDLVVHLSQPSIPKSSEHIDTILTRFKQYFLSNGLSSEWGMFQSAINNIAVAKSPSQIANYLVFLDALNEGRPNKRSRVTNLHSSPYRAVSAATTATAATNTTASAILEPLTPSSGQGGTGGLHPTLHQSMSAHYTSLPEKTILTYLPYTLLGVDSKIFTFTNSSELEIPSTINHSYSGLLHNILEPALIYRKLNQLIDSSSRRNNPNNMNISSSMIAGINSPIKIAFLRSLEQELNLYVKEINGIFNQSKSPESVLVVYNQLYSNILKLRLLYSISNDLELITGYELLSKVDNLSKFGNLIIKEISTSILITISKPYFEILEHWIIQGELIDNNNEFFIHYNVEAQNLNDIIQFSEDKIPEFIISINKDLGYKIYQIGKLLIFLSKYCRELTWINEYGVKYSNIIFREHSGLQSMGTNEIIQLIDQQYKELLHYFTITIQKKYGLFQHLIQFKSFLLMNSNDFIESLISKGSTLFNEPSNILTSNQLSKILMESISNSSVKNLNPEYKNRLDARILDLNGGNIGWEVFTLEYKIGDLPIDHILNHGNNIIGYLKVFNFLWKLKNLNFLLNIGFIESGTLIRNDLKKLRLTYTKLKSKIRRKEKLMSLRDEKIIWLMRSFNKVCIIRNRFIKFISILLKYLSYDIIETSFNQLVVKKLFKSKISTVQVGNKFEIIPELSKGFLESITKKKTNNNVTNNGIIPNNEIHNMNELTIDELISIHTNYLKSIINCKLLNEQEIGKFSGESFIQQIYEFLEIQFAFIKGSEEFSSLIVKYVSLLNIDENIQVTDDIDMDQFDDEFVEIEGSLQNMMDRIHNELYQGEFLPKLERFVKDLRGTIEFREMSKFF
ncbi:spindle pole body component Spc98p [[Candida] anglica]